MENDIIIGDKIISYQPVINYNNYPPTMPLIQMTCYVKPESQNLVMKEISKKYRSKRILFWNNSGN